MFLLPPNGANTAEQNSTAQPNTHRAHSRVNFIAELRLKGNINMEIMNMLGQWKVTAAERLQTTKPNYTHYIVLRRYSTPSINRPLKTNCWHGRVWYRGRGPSPCHPVASVQFPESRSPKLRPGTQKQRSPFQWGAKTFLARFIWVPWLHVPSCRNISPQRCTVLLLLIPNRFQNPFPTPSQPLLNHFPTPSRTPSVDRSWPDLPCLQVVPPCQLDSPSKVTAE